MDIIEAIEAEAMSQYRAYMLGAEDDERTLIHFLLSDMLESISSRLRKDANAEG